MYKKILVLTTILVIGLASLALADPPPFSPWKCLVYDGMVWHSPVFDPPGVIEDTGVFVTNPNPVPVAAWIRIFNKYGKEVWSGFLWDTDEPIKRIPSMGFGWMPLGWALNDAGYVAMGREKFTYQISMSPPTTDPRLPCVVEVKQVIYSQPTPPLLMLAQPGGPVPANKISSWCEANPEKWTRCPQLP